MSSSNLRDKNICSTQGCSPCEKGTNNLLLGAGVGAYGTATFLATGAVCPTCIVIAPALLGYGAYKRIKFNQKKREEAAQANS